jgi:hypothetical protein
MFARRRARHSRSGLTAGLAHQQARQLGVHHLGRGLVCEDIDHRSRTIQAAGKLGAMFIVIADRHEEDLRTAMKRGTALLEQAAVALVAIVIGAVVLGLVGAMTSVYESIG